MGVSSNDSGNSPVQKSSDRDLLARGLRMGIDEDNRCLFPQPVDLFIKCQEGVLQGRLHERASLDIYNTDLPFWGLQDDGTIPRSVWRIINRTQQAWLRIQEGNDIFLIPDMIPRRDHRHATA